MFQLVFIPSIITLNIPEIIRFHDPNISGIYYHENATYLADSANMQTIIQSRPDNKISTILQEGKVCAVLMIKYDRLLILERTPKILNVNPEIFKLRIIFNAIGDLQRNEHQTIWAKFPETSVWSEGSLDELDNIILAAFRGFEHIYTFEIPLGKQKNENEISYKQILLHLRIRFFNLWKILDKDSLFVTHFDRRFRIYEIEKDKSTRDLICTHKLELDLEINAVHLLSLQKRKYILIEVDNPRAKDDKDNGKRIEIRVYKYKKRKNNFILIGVPLKFIWPIGGMCRKELQNVLIFDSKEKKLVEFEYVKNGVKRV